MIKSYTTFAGAKREARKSNPPKPILRVLDDPHELFVVGFSLIGTDLMAVDSSSGKCDGSIRFEELSTRG